MTWENRLTFEVSSADPDSDAPVWVDLTSRIRDMLQPVEVDIGRQNDLEQTEPTTWTMVLENSDDALTYGNTSSPYAAWWGPGRKCRLRETVGGVIDDVATGYLQVPTETLSLAGIEHRVAVSIVDRLGRLQAAEPFISTLAAHIRYAGGGALKFYAPLNDPPNWVDVVGRLPAVRVIGLFNNPGSFIDGASGNLALADDIGTVGQLTTSTTIGEQHYFSWNLASSGLHMADGQVATIAAWVKPSGMYGPALSITFTDNGSGTNVQQAVQTADNGFWRVTAVGTLTADLITSRAAMDGDATLLAIRFGYNPSTVELWIGGQDRFIAAVAGAPPTSNTLVEISSVLLGQISHMQVYIGAQGDFSFAAFQAQYQMGTLALQRQTTGDRIRTIAQYAGIPNAEFANTVDTGQSVMQAARLASRTPLDTMREAEVTEQGLLYVDETGRLVFKDRRSLNNI